MENEKNFYKNADENREISKRTIGAIGNLGTVGTMGTIRTMGTMENGKNFLRTLMKVEKYL